MVFLGNMQIIGLSNGKTTCQQQKVRIKPSITCDEVWQYYGSTFIWCSKKVWFTSSGREIKTKIEKVLDSIISSWYSWICHGTDYDANIKEYNIQWKLDSLILPPKCAECALLNFLIYPLTSPDDHLSGMSPGQGHALKLWGHNYMAGHILDIFCSVACSQNGLASSHGWLKNNATNSFYFVFICISLRRIRILFIIYFYDFFYF